MKTLSVRCFESVLWTLGRRPPNRSCRRNCLRPVCVKGLADTPPQRSKSPKRPLEKHSTPYQNFSILGTKRKKDFYRGTRVWRPFRVRLDWNVIYNLPHWWPFTVITYVKVRLGKNFFYLFFVYGPWKKIKISISCKSSIQIAQSKRLSTYKRLLLSDSLCYSLLYLWRHQHMPLWYPLCILEKDRRMEGPIQNSSRKCTSSLWRLGRLDHLHHHQRKSRIFLTVSSETSLRCLQKSQNINSCVLLSGQVMRNIIWLNVH